MRGWYKPNEGRWIDIGEYRNYDHPASIGDHIASFSVRVASDSERLVPLEGQAATASGAEVWTVYDFQDHLGDAYDLNDIAVAMGWVRINCAAAVTSGPYIHARSEADLRKAMAFVEKQSGIDLRDAEGFGFRGEFGGVVYDIDLDTGGGTVSEFGFDERGRLKESRTTPIAPVVPAGDDDVAEPTEPRL